MRVWDWVLGKGSEGSRETEVREWISRTGAIYHRRLARGRDLVGHREPRCCTGDRMVRDTRGVNMRIVASKPGGCTRISPVGWLY